MKDKTLEDHIFSLSDEDFEKEFKKEFLNELNKCENEFKKKFNNSKSVKYVSKDDLQIIYSYMSNKNIQSYSNNIIYVGSTVQVQDEMSKGSIFCWNKIYAQNNMLVVESNDFDLCLDILKSMKQAELKYKIKFIEINPYGEHTGFIEEIN
jgi:hypothetical protein